MQEHHQIFITLIEWKKTDRMGAKIRAIADRYNTPATI